MTDSLLAWIAGIGAATNHPAVLALLFAGAAIEYVVPPAPGDVVTLGGAVLVAAYDWNLPLVYALLVLGSVSGSALAFFFGRAWRARRRQRGRLEDIATRFRERGTLYLLGHRFIPGMRSVFLVAAGLAQLSPLRTLFLSGISALLWFALILAAGLAIGENLDHLQDLLSHYSRMVWGLLALVFVLWLLRRWRRRRTRSKAPPTQSPETRAP